MQRCAAHHGARSARPLRASAMFVGRMAFDGRALSRIGLGFGLLCALWSAAAPVHAQLYVCTTASGRTISGDMPPPECRDRQVRELGKDGAVRRIIEPPLTPEQRRARDEEAERQRIAADEARQQMRRDRALLETYATEEDIEISRGRALANRQALIERSTQRIVDYKKDRIKLENEAEFFAKRDMPDELKRSIQNNESLRRQEEKIIGDMRADMERINGRFDAERRRFRELVDNGSTPRPHGP